MNDGQNSTGFDVHTARNLLRSARHASLATTIKNGSSPYVSLVNMATDGAANPVVLISELAWHTQNLLLNSQAALLITGPQTKGDVLQSERITLMGRFERLTGNVSTLKQRYLALHPGAAFYADFKDFSLWRMELEKIHGVAGFGRIETMQAHAIMPDPQQAAAITASEPQLLAQLNADYADEIAAIAAKTLPDEQQPCQCGAVDGDGVVITGAVYAKRLLFAQPATTSDAIIQQFAALAKSINQ